MARLMTVAIAPLCTAIATGLGIGRCSDSSGTVEKLAAPQATPMQVGPITVMPVRAIAARNSAPRLRPSGSAPSPKPAA